MVSDLLSAFAVSSADHVWQNLADGIAAFRMRNHREDLYWRVKLIQARLQADLYLELMAQTHCGFSALILYPVDALGHAYWRWHEASAFQNVDPALVELRGDVVRSAYREADQQLGRLLDRLDLTHTRLVIVSDHGMEAITRGGKEIMTARVNAATLTQILGMEGRLRNAVAGKQLILSSKIGGAEGVQDLAQVHAVLEAAHVEGSPQAKPFRLDPFRPEAGTVVVNYRPSVMGNLQNRIVIAGNTLPVSEVFREEHRTGTHTLRGIIAMLGPGIEPGAEIQDADLYDLAPTLLYLMGLPVPEDLPGRVLSEGMSAEHLAAHPIQTRRGGLPEPPALTETLEDLNMLQENLEQMGYTEVEE